MLGLLFTAAAFGQGDAEKYVGQYQVTGVPLVITVTAEGGKAMAARLRGSRSSSSSWSRAKTMQLKELR